MIIVLGLSYRFGAQAPIRPSFNLSVRYIWVLSGVPDSSRYYTRRGRRATGGFANVYKGT